MQEKSRKTSTVVILLFIAIGLIGFAVGRNTSSIKETESELFSALFNVWPKNPLPIFQSKKKVRYFAIDFAPYMGYNKGIFVCERNMVNETDYQAIKRITEKLQ